MVKFSPKAIAELHRWSQSQPAASSTETWTVTLSKITGSCQPWAYDLQLSAASDSDQGTTLGEGLQLAIAGNDTTWCDELTVDYSEDLIGGGFQFTNSKATQTCSCGVSFAL